MSREQLQALLERFAATRPAEPPPLPEARAQWHAQALTFQPEDVAFVPASVGGVPAEWNVHAGGGEEAQTCFVFLHGGAYISGSPVTHRRLTAAVARRWPGRVLSVDYRLAPEHPFPAAVEDVVRVLAALDGPVVLAGDSAGGGLALAAMLQARDEGVPLPRAAWLICPWADLTMTAPSVNENAGSDPVIRKDHLDAAALMYAGAGDLRAPLLSPAFADLAGLPPLLIQVAAGEVLLDDSLALARAAARSDTAATLQIWPGMVHSFVAIAGLLDEADAAIVSALGWLRQEIGVPLR